MIKGGKRLNSSPPAFSNDAKKILICTGNTVSIFSTSASLLITELEGHTALVTSVIVLPASTSANKILCYCWTSSLDGTIRYWDFSVPELMKTIPVRSPIYSMVIPSRFGQPDGRSVKQADVFAYLSVEYMKKQGGQIELASQIQKCNLTQSRLAGGIVLAEVLQPEFLTMSPSGEYFCIPNKNRVRIWEVPEKDSDRAQVKKIVLRHSRNLTALAFHPSERIIAAGDVTGRILIWRGFGQSMFSTASGLKKGGSKNEEERSNLSGGDVDSCTTWHWHSAEVKILSFSSDGAYLMSGGNEGVLVVWHLDTGKRRFLPRIGSPLLYYTESPDPSLSSISCADNQVHLLKMPSLEIMKSISGIKLRSPIQEIDWRLQRGFVFNHAAGLVALQTENYCIQLYSLYADREMSQVQVIERNYQPGEHVTAAVVLVALSLDGFMMSTVEVKFAEEDVGGLVCLKFWDHGSEQKDFSLSTIVYEPHREAGISAIAYHPTRPMAVSSSYGGDFKVWVHSQGSQKKDQKLQNIGWTCHSVGSYKKKPMTAATFSADGSVLAVAAEIVITLWDPEENVLVAVIGETIEPITALSFAGASDYLVSLSKGAKPQLSVWSMSEQLVSWSYKLHTEDIACMADTSFFAVLAFLPEISIHESNEVVHQEVDGVIMLFDVENPVPVATWFVRKASGGGIAFIDRNESLLEKDSNGKPQAMLLAYVNGDHEYVLFDPFNKDLQLSAPRKVNLLGSEETGKFGYASIYGELQESDHQSNKTSYIPFISSEKPWDTICSGSSHNLPPLTKLCSAFLESLLERRTEVMQE